MKQNGSLSIENRLSPVVIYEVVRIIEGIPVFLEDHLDRLYHSTRITGLDILPGPIALKNEISQLIREEKKETGNIKLSFTFNVESASLEREMKFIPHFYPEPQAYLEGVPVTLMKADRQSPSAKIQHIDIRERANKMIAELNVFEVLLVDQNNKITEGSRSNVFFVRDNMLFTSPDDKVLGGITRNKVIGLCRKAGIPVVDSEIPAERLSGYKAAFLTGTSPKVLPISSVDDIFYETSFPLIRKIIDLYDKAVREYIDSRK
jgi:branched-chain amino acid aminotransferase